MVLAHIGFPLGVVVVGALIGTASAPDEW